MNFHGLKPIIDYVNSLGIKTLENENVYIGEKKNRGFNLCGVYDRFGFKYKVMNQISIKQWKI